MRKHKTRARGIWREPQAGDAIARVEGDGDGFGVRHRLALKGFFMRALMRVRIIEAHGKTAGNDTRDHR
jgi:hypothetical protein